jgi:MFS family permease
MEDAAAATEGTARPARRGLGSFTVVWAGQLVSMLGSGLSNFGLVVWLYERTQAATPYALAFLTATLPGILLAPLAGHLADRKSRKAIVMLADSGNALVTLGILLLVATGRLEPWMVYVITFLSSSFGTFQEPAWSAAVPTIVPKEQLGRANGLAGVSQALSTLLPPLLAGILFGRIGLTGLVAIDFITYFAAVGTMAFVRIPRVKATSSGDGKESFLSDVAFGFRYLAKKKGLLGLVFYFATANFCLNFAMVLLGPMIIPASGSEGLGIAQTAFGAGALVAGLIVAVWGGPKKSRVAFVMASLFVSALGLIVAGLRPALALQSIGLFILLFAIQMANAAPIFQTKVEAGAQGRTRAARSMISMSLMPLASLTAGPLADRVFGPALQPGGGLASGALGRLLGTGAGRGPGLMFVMAGLLLVLATVVAWLRPDVRRIEENLPDLI